MCAVSGVQPLLFFPKLDGVLSDFPQCQCVALQVSETKDTLSYPIIIDLIILSDLIILCHYIMSYIFILYHHIIIHIPVDLNNSTLKKTLVFCLVSVIIKFRVRVSDSVLGLEQKTVDFIGVEK